MLHEHFCLLQFRTNRQPGLWNTTCYVIINRRGDSLIYHYFYRVLQSMDKWIGKSVSWSLVHATCSWRQLVLLLVCSSFSRQSTSKNISLIVNAEELTHLLPSPHFFHSRWLGELRSEAHLDYFRFHNSQFNCFTLCARAIIAFT